MLVLDRVDLCANQGQIVALLGPNGAGKTTLVRILTTLLRPDGGRARVAGYDVVDRRGPLRRRSAWPGSTRRSTSCSPGGRTSSWSASGTTCRSEYRAVPRSPGAVLADRSR